MAKLIFDVDGVLMNFINYYMELVAKECSILKIDVPETNPAFVTSWDWYDEHLTQPQRNIAHGLLGSVSFWENQPLMFGARELISRLENCGHELVYATSPCELCSTWENLRRKALRNNFRAKSDNIIITNRKELLEADFLVEDKAATVEHWLEAHTNGKAFLISSAYNKHYTHLRCKVVRFSDNYVRWEDSAIDSFIADIGSRMSL